MPRHLALLRGINVGGRNRVAMADLRELAASLGHTDVRTHGQSGNVVFGSEESDSDALADALEEALFARLGVRAPVIVLTRRRLARAVAANPYPHAVEEPRHLHLVFRRGAFGGADDEAALTLALERAAARGGRDEARIADGTLYLHTPDGLGRSELAASLARRTTVDATARNWRTVTTLLELLDAP